MDRLYSTTYDNADEGLSPEAEANIRANGGSEEFILLAKTCGGPMMQAIIKAREDNLDPFKTLMALADFSASMADTLIWQISDSPEAVRKLGEAYTTAHVESLSRGLRMQIDAYTGQHPAPAGTH